MKHELEYERPENLNNELTILFWDKKHKVSNRWRHHEMHGLTKVIGITVQRQRIAGTKQYSESCVVNVKNYIEHAYYLR